MYIAKLAFYVKLAPVKKKPSVIEIFVVKLFRSCLAVQSLLSCPVISSRLCYAVLAVTLRAVPSWLSCPACLDRPFQVVPSL
jgi:hypothetical protein